MGRYGERETDKLEKEKVLEHFGGLYNQMNDLIKKFTWYNKKSIRKRLLDLFMASVKDIE